MTSASHFHPALGMVDDEAKPEPSACLNCGKEIRDGEPRARYVDRGEVHGVSCPEPSSTPKPAFHPVHGHGGSDE